MVQKLKDTRARHYLKGRIVAAETPPYALRLKGYCLGPGWGKVWSRYACVFVWQD